MKKVTFITLLIFASCTFNKQHKAEQLAKKYLDTTLNDPHSYESVRFDTLVTVYSEFAIASPEGRLLDTLAASFIDSSSKYRKLNNNLFSSEEKSISYIKHNALMDTIFSRKSDSVEKIIKQKSIGFKAPVFGYRLTHTYRAKNGFGALSLHTTEFDIDSTLTKITNANER